jgi:MFS family permease
MTSRRGRATGDESRGDPSIEVPGAIRPVAAPGGEPPAATAAIAPRRPFSAFRHPSFRIVWTGSFISNTGSWMQTVAQGWLVLELTDSAFMLGLVGFAGTLPMLILLLLGGVFADRVDRRRLLMIAISSMMAVAAILAMITYLEVVRTWHILVLALLLGSALALSAPAYQAFIHDLVGREDLQSGIALNSAQFNLSRVVGPSLAGLAVSAIGLAGCFAINAISYIASITALSLVRVAPRSAPVTMAVWESLLEGFSYVRQRPRVQALLVITMLLSVMAMPYATLLPIIARDALGLDAAGLGYLFAIGGIGAVSGAMSLAVRGRFARRGLYLLGCAAVSGLAVMTLGIAREPVVAGAALVGVGFAATSSIALTNTLLQELVHDEMRGRVLSMFGLAFMGTFPLGNLLAGTIAAATSASTTLALTGGVLFVSIAMIAVLTPRLRDLD